MSRLKPSASPDSRRGKGEFTTIVDRIPGGAPMTEPTTSSLVETLGGLDVFDEVRLTLAEGTVVEGRVHPVTFAPNHSLRLEVCPRLGEDRYEVQARFENGRWTRPEARRFRLPDDEWTLLGPLAGAERVRPGRREDASPAEWPALPGSIF